MKSIIIKDLKRIIIFLPLLITIYFMGCKKDPPVDTPEDNSPPTPYTLNIPTFVLCSSIDGSMPIPSNNPLTIEGVELGRMLFYEKKLSGNNTISCASCHIQNHGFSDTAQFSGGTNGQLGNRQAMAIINAGWFKAQFWDGRANTLEEQAFAPVTNPIEMNTTWPQAVAKLQADTKYPPLFKKVFGSTTIDSVMVSKAISQFERTLISFNSKFDTYYYGNDTTVFNASEKNGLAIFLGVGKCVQCHTPPFMMDHTFRNNGLDAVLTDLGLGAITAKPSDDGKFKVPTLRNIEKTAPYMHDGRFKTLMETVEHYNSGVVATSPNLNFAMNGYVGGLGLTAQEKLDLVAFLKTLTDNTFLSNPNFSNPH